MNRSKMDEDRVPVESQTGPLQSPRAASRAASWGNSQVIVSLSLCWKCLWWQVVARPAQKTRPVPASLEPQPQPFPSHSFSSRLTNMNPILIFCHVYRHFWLINSTRRLSASDVCRWPTRSRRLTHLCCASAYSFVYWTALQSPTNQNEIFNCF